MSEQESQKLEVVEPTDIDLNVEIRNAMKAVYPSPVIPRVVLLPIDAFDLALPNLLKERGFQKSRPYEHILVCNGVIMPSMIE